MLWFITMAFVSSGILYGARGNSGMHYIDCLFLSTSAVTVTGLVTVPVSQTTLGQQIVLFVLMALGNLVMNSLVIVLLRRHFFGNKFRHVMRRSATTRKRMKDIEVQERKEHEEEMERFRRFFGLGHEDHDLDEKRHKHKTQHHKRPRLHAGMVQRMDEPARQVNPTGQMTTMVANSDHDSEPLQGILQTPSGAPHDPHEQHLGQAAPGVRIADAPPLLEEGTLPSVRLAEPHTEPLPSSNAPHKTTLDARPRPRPEADAPLTRWHSLEPEAPKKDNNMRRVHTVAFPEQTPRAETERDRLPRTATTGTMPPRTRTLSMERTATLRSNPDGPSRGTALHRTMTRNMNTGLGGFPNPLEIACSLLESANVHRRLRMPRSSTMASMHPSRSHTVTSGDDVRMAPYLTFDAEVTGNSHFVNLTHAQRVELGGVEYRALDVLAWLIPTYWFAWLFLALVIATPYMASGASRPYREALSDQTKPPHSPEWYWVFNALSALTNTGMSLSDTSFQGRLSNAYLLLIPAMVLILVGNTAYPVMLRFIIWTLAQCVSQGSRLYETLRFLLDHPRRCFVYLFPRENTWFLFFLVLGLTILDWFFLMILDLSRRKESFSDGAWVFDALFQSVATRAAGFQTFNTLDLAPAEQMMQVFMMYLAVFPVTMAVRTTNVYEEGSLGLYDNTNEESSSHEGGRAVWGRFLPEQVRRQVAFDLWWIALAVFVILIAEQGKLENAQTYPDLTIFTVLYETVSAYGTVGLSCGSQFVNGASLAADFTVVSKLVLVAVMIRGRHRGLPGAIDRAIMLPSELQAFDQSHDPHASDAPPAPPAPDGTPALGRTSSIRSHASGDGRQRTATPASDGDRLAPITEASQPASPASPASPTTPASPVSTASPQKAPSRIATPEPLAHTPSPRHSVHSL